MTAQASAPRPVRLVPDDPDARADVARVACAGQHLLWSPWAPPVLLDARSLAILDALDGSPLTDLIDALADVEQRPRDEVDAELRSVVHQLAWHGLLVSSPPWRRWSPAALGRPVTECDREAWQLDGARIVDLEIGGRRATVVSSDRHLDEALDAQDSISVLDPTEDLATAHLELMVAPGDRPNGVHRLFGRAGRTYRRSTDPVDLIRSFTAHLGTLAWMVSRPDLVWLDALALRIPGGVALLDGIARYDWARLGRRLAADGIVPIESVQVALDPSTGELVVPPPPDPDVVALGRDWARRAGLDDPAVTAGSFAESDSSGELPVSRVDHVAGTAELERFAAAGHSPDDLDPALGAQRLALLARRGAMDLSIEPPDPARTATILATIADVSSRPGVVHRLHHQVADLLRSLRH